MQVVVNMRFGKSTEWYGQTISDSQNGFRQGRGCTDSTFGVKRIQQIAWQKNLDLHCLFLDMKAAYDWVVRSWLWKVLRSRISEKQEGLKFLMGRIEDLYSSTFAFMTGNELDTKFVCSSGLRQGGVESPPLFNVWQYTVLKEYRRKCLEKGIGFDVDYAIHSFASTREEARKLGLNGKYTVTEICYADNIAIFPNNATSLSEATQILHKLMSAYGITICSTKTKTMVMSPTSRR